MKRTIRKNNGFTFVEIMIAMVIAGLVIGGIYGVYTIQQRSYTVQEQVSEMQQRIRSAMDFMTRDMRMATFTVGCSGEAKILTAAKEDFQFQYCDENTTTNTMEIFDFRYDLYDSDGDGVNDLGRTKGGMKRALAEGVDGLEFQYLEDDAATETTNVNDIRFVRISMLVRAAYPDRKYTDTNTYRPASGTWTLLNGVSNPPNDNFHRRLLISTVKLRNMGLKK